MYESTLVGAFQYSWGYRDAVANKPFISNLVTNAQNPLDSLIGDLIGRINGRFFIVEFKRDFADFEAEIIGSNAKPARQALHLSMINNWRCREISPWCHFSCWSDGEIRLWSYGRAVDDSFFSNYKKPQYSSYWYDEIDFVKFYDSVNHPDNALSDMTPSLYANGVGVPANGMLEYLEEMLASHPGVGSANAESAALFGFVSPSNGVVKLVPTSFDGLLAEFARHKAVVASATGAGFLPTSGP